VSGFGEEWSTFDQTKLSDIELQEFFNKYFSLLDWSSIADQSLVMDVGCGSGRWAKLVAPLVGNLHLVDPSEQALAVARRNLNGIDNCTFFNVPTQDLPGLDASYDLIYSLGVLHHIPDTQEAIIDCVRKLKSGAPFLVYLYYRFDNRSLWFRVLWKISDVGRRLLSGLPFFIKKRLTDFIAFSVYLPLARLSKVLSALGRSTSSVPLSFYKDSSFYTMRTDALDRFGTRLEHRFTKLEIERMLTTAGLTNIQFRESEPFWCAIGYRA
jgi:ubiquinone/menaquinone biosynthesis C-methylase UbiE